MYGKRKKAVSVREQFIRGIENKILSGELKPGDKLLPSRELCALMGVSLTVVNAGVSQLVSRGFLEVKPRHGTYVADYRKNGSIETFASILRYNGGQLNPLEIRNFCETRMAMDPFVAALVIERADKAELIKLQALVLSLEQETDVDAACALEGESAII